MKEYRRGNGNVPLLVLYAIDKDSVPGSGTRDAPPRRHMGASDHVIGFGLVLQQVDGADVEYVAVKPMLRAGYEVELENTIAVEDDDLGASPSMAVKA